MAGQEGLEPTTLGFGIRCSTIGAIDLLVTQIDKSLFVVRN